MGLGAGFCQESSACVTSLLSLSAWAAVTKDHRWFGLNNRHVFPFWRLEDHNQVPGEDSLPDLQMAVFLLCRGVRKRERTLSPVSSYAATNPSRGPHSHDLITSQCAFSRYIMLGLGFNL